MAVEVVLLEYFSLSLGHLPGILSSRFFFAAFKEFRASRAAMRSGRSSLDHHLDVDYYRLGSSFLSDSLGN